MQSYPHGGGFSVDASVRIAQHDRQGLERLLRYCARPPFAGQRIRIEGEQIIYRCSKAPAGEQGDTSVGGKRAHEIVLTPLEFIARIAALVPPPRQHRHRYYGVLAPNARQRGQVIPVVIPPLTPSEGDSMTQPLPTDPPIGPKASSVHHQSRYSWAKLIARVYETDPLLCGRYGGRTKIIAFVVQASELRQILAHVGLQVEAPRTYPARGPPQSDLWDSATASEWEVKETYSNAADQDQSLHW
jgi:Putative transposase